MKSQLLLLIIEYTSKINVLKSYMVNNPNAYPAVECNAKIEAYQQVILDLKDLVR